MWFCRLSILSSRGDLDQKNLSPWCRKFAGDCLVSRIKSTPRRYVVVFKTASISLDPCEDLSRNMQGCTIKLTWRDLGADSGHIYVATFEEGKQNVVSYTPLQWITLERGVDFTWLKTDDFLMGRQLSEMNKQLRNYLKANKLEKFICIDDLITGLSSSL